MSRLANALLWLLAALVVFAVLRALPAAEAFRDPAGAGRHEYPARPLHPYPR